MYNVDMQGTMLTATEGKLLDMLISKNIGYKICPGFTVRLDRWGDAIIDIAFPDLKLGVEVNGFIFNSTPEQQKKDMERDLALEAEGWKILRILDQEIDDHPNRVMHFILSRLKQCVSSL